ncbi:MAG: Ig-like domain-containing protein [Candidatus Kapabacteria bacterium]|nr:Ig-like domain-containing protein [Candidatus Kapabacteria bacterium]MDW8012600.1 Ig-like domain-containing protein [Bacteroidota bacterium]
MGRRWGYRTWAVLGLCCAVGVFLAGCANPLLPPGGPPDREPPQVVSTEPVSGTTHFRGNTIVLRFSEFVDKASVLASLSLQPQKPWRATWDWLGKTLSLRFTEPLDSNTTYVLTLGTDYRDIAGNTAAAAVSVVFSTGERIDRGQIEGRLVDAQPAGVFVLAYPLANLQPDTLNPAHTRARYWTQVGTAGTFRLQGLPDGEYRLFALRDADRDGLYTEGRDGIGTTVESVFVRADTPAVALLRLNPVLDQAPPELMDVRPQSQQRVRLVFSEPLDTASVQASAVVVEDSTGSVRLPIVAAYLVPGSSAMVELMMAQPVMDTLSLWFLHLLPGGIRDTSGNVVAPQQRRFRFRRGLDTAWVRWATVPPDSFQSLLPWQPLELIAEAPLDSTTAEVSIRDERGRAMPYRWEVVAPNHWRLWPQGRWDSEQWQQLRVHFRSRQLPGGRMLADTLLVRSFRSVDTRQYADLAGELQDSLRCRGPYILEVRATRGASGIWRQELPQPGPWRFRELPPGFYELEAFCDEDRNGRYSAGQAFPYRFAERFVRVGPIELKPRWSTEGVLVRMP